VTLRFMSMRALLYSLLALVLAGLIPYLHAQNPESTTAITHVNVIPMNKDGVLPEAS
jgi:hypothetical protein